MDHFWIFTNGDEEVAIQKNTIRQFKDRAITVAYSTTEVHHLSVDQSFSEIQDIIEEKEESKHGIGYHQLHHR